MDCWGRCTTSGATGTVKVTFPVPFVDASYVPLLTAEYYSNNYPSFECGAQRTSENGMNVYTRQSNGSLLGGVICDWYAVGRWK